MHMFATSYSILHKLLQWRTFCRQSLMGVMLVMAAWFDLPARADTNRMSTPAEFRAYADRQLAAARRSLREYPTNSRVLQRFAQAGFDRGEFSRNDSERAMLAEECIAVCRQWVARETNSAAAHYYLGMNLGQLARTKMLGALPIVDEMEVEFKAAEGLDPHFDYAGPVRNLGLLYRDAPSLGSIGDRGKARTYLRRAIELAPDFPENRLNYVETCLKWVDWPAAAREMKQLDAIWDSARTNLTGDAWASSWADWQQRRHRAKVKIVEDSKIGSPKHRQ